MPAYLLYRLWRRRRNKEATPDVPRAGVSGVTRPVVLRRIAVAGFPAIVVASYWRSIAVAHLNVSSHLGGQGFVHDAGGLILFVVSLIALGWFLAGLLFVVFSARDLGRFFGAALAPGLVPLPTASVFVWLLALLVSLAVLVWQVNRDEIEPPDPNEISEYHQGLLNAGYSEENAARLAKEAADHAANEIIGDSEAVDEDASDEDDE